MSWRITETNQVDSESIDRLGGKFLIGNGYLGYRGTLEEHTREQRVAVIVSGLYDQVADLWREPVNLPNGCYLELRDDDGPLLAHRRVLDGHTQTLDMYRGVHERRTRFPASGGTTVTVRSRRFASLEHHHLLCLEYVVTADRDITLTVRTGIDGQVWDQNGPHLEDQRAVREDATIALTARTHQNRVPVAVAECLHRDGAGERILAEDGRILREFTVRVTAGQPLAITKYVAHYTGLDSEQPLADARQLCRQACQRGFAGLESSHAALWRQRWDACDVQIRGDEQAEQALRFSMYHLLAVAPTHSDRVSIPARGLSGQVYKGAIFWDTEIFMLPFFSYTFPSIAKNLLMYRYHTLDGARRKAREYGYRGAFYAWESQDTGDDGCTLFNITDVFTNRPMRTYFRDKQLHISADIVYAIWDYVQITRDDTVLTDGCAEVIFECARFLLSTLYYNRERDRAEILDVTGPDEYHERVHNNAYTNQMTAHVFDVLLELHRYLAEHHPEPLAALMDRLDFDADLAAVREVAGQLYLPRPDPESELVEQFDGYFSLEDVSLGDLLARKLHPNEYLGGGNGLASTTQIIKQADVVLMMHLFSRRYAPSVQAANWNYYEPRTEHGSSLSACAYALVAARIGKTDWSYKYFIQAASIDLVGHAKHYVGTLYIGGTHPAANGGAWMAAVLGLGGVRSEGEALSTAPRLPEHWTELTVRLTFRGQRLRLRITPRATVVETLEPTGPALGPGEPQEGHQ